MYVREMGSAWKVVGGFLEHLYAYILFKYLVKPAIPNVSTLILVTHVAHGYSGRPAHNFPGAANACLPRRAVHHDL